MTVTDPTDRRSDAGAAAPPASGWPGTDLEIRLRRGVGGTIRAEGVMCSAPVWTRWDGDTLWLVGSGASPVGEDHIRVRVDVGPGVEVAVRSVAATMIYAARGSGTTWDTELCVADGASLDWRPEPVILTERARHVATTTVRAAAGAAVTLDEVLVLGRSGEPTGAMCSTFDVSIDGRRVLLTSNDTSVPGWSGPAGTDGAPVVANRLRLGPDRAPTGQQESGDATDSSRTALLHPADGCRLAVATADDVAGARRALDLVLPG